MKVVALYSSLLTFLFLLLSFRTIGKRRKLKISIGHSENPEMLRAIRAHSNCIEYVPLALFCMALQEYNGANVYYIHFLGILLVLGRSLHAFGVSQVEENFKFRVTGMMLTFTNLIMSSCMLLFTYLKS